MHGKRDKRGGCPKHKELSAAQKKNKTTRRKQETEKKKTLTA